MCRRCKASGQRIDRCAMMQHDRYRALVYPWKALGCVLVMIGVAGEGAAFRQAPSSKDIRKLSPQSAATLQITSRGFHESRCIMGATDRGARCSRTRLHESIRQNREKITRSMSKLRDAMRSGDEELAERLKAFIVHLRKRDPQFATQDAMDEALSEGLFSTAAKLKLKLADINQNPFRQGLLEPGDGETGGGDASEDMSWGFDKTFFEDEGEIEDDYDDI